MLDFLNQKLSQLAAEVDRLPRLRWGTVIVGNPLKVVFDGDTFPLVGLINFAGALKTGDRVGVLLANRRGIVLGSPTSRIPIDNKVILNGQEYQSSGVFPVIPTFRDKANFPPIYCGHLDFPTPFIPPPGYGFTIHVLGTTGYPAGLEVYNQNASIIYARFMQIGSVNLSLQRVGWRLVRV